MREDPGLAPKLRLLKAFLKHRRMPGTKQGLFPAIVWIRRAIRFVQERGDEANVDDAEEWLRRFLVRRSRIFKPRRCSLGSTT